MFGLFKKKEVISEAELINRLVEIAHSTEIIYSALLRTMIGSRFDSAALRKHASAVQMYAVIMYASTSYKTEIAMMTYTFLTQSLSLEMQVIFDGYYGLFDPLAKKHGGNVCSYEFAGDIGIAFSESYCNEEPSVREHKNTLFGFGKDVYYDTLSLCVERLDRCVLR